MRRLFCIILFLILCIIYIFSNSYYMFALVLTYLLLIMSSAFMFINSQAELSVLFPEGITKNDKAEATVIARNDGLLPVARMDYTVVCENALVGEKAQLKLSVSPFSKGMGRSELKLKNPHIGKIDISVENIKIWDYFGLFSKKVSAPKTKSGFVYPTFRDVEIAVESLPEIPGEGERYFQGKRGSDVNEQLALRDYDQGDELRSIHWKLTSKMDKLIVREFGLPVRYAVMVIIELTMPESKKSDVLDECVETGLSLSRNLLQQGISHNIAWYADEALNVRELSNEEDLLITIPELLTARAYTGLSHAIDSYSESEFINQRLSPIYVTSVIDTDKLSEVSVRQPLKTYCITDKNGQLGDVEKNLDITMICINEEGSKHA